MNGRVDMVVVGRYATGSLRKEAVKVPNLQN